jgi:hypothetical protein
MLILHQHRCRALYYISHYNYDDCVRWYSDLLLSKCAAGAMAVLWKPVVRLIVFDNSDITAVIVGGSAVLSKERMYDITVNFI